MASINHPYAEQVELLAEAITGVRPEVISMDLTFEGELCYEILFPSRAIVWVEISDLKKPWVSQVYRIDRKNHIDEVANTFIEAVREEGTLAVIFRKRD